MSGPINRRKSPAADSQGPHRRMGDRRDSPRIPLQLWVRMVDAGGSFEEKKGDVGVGGAYFEDRFPPVGTAVQLRFRLPGGSEEIRCEGEVLRTCEESGRFGSHVRFVNLSTEAELAIARFIDDHELSQDD